MELTRRIDKILNLVIAIIFVVFLGCLIKFVPNNTFADNGEDVTSYDAENAKFVTFYDGGEELTIRTNAETVGEAISRAEIVINEGDIVDPGMDTDINADNFFINIHRARPVLVIDGVVEKYSMSASYDVETIVSDAGLALYDGDEIKQVDNTGFLEMGMVEIYQITRNGGRTLTIEEEIPFEEEIIKDYNLEPGVEEVRQLGEVGMKRSYYTVLYSDNKEVSREFVSEEVVRAPVARIKAVGATAIEQNPLTAGMGRNYYTYTKSDGSTVLRQETYYDLNMGVVINYCGSSYSVRSDGVKVDQDGYVLVAANLSRYPRCSVVETSLGAGKVYDTGGFASSNPEQFDLATDWSNHDGI